MLYPTPRSVLSRAAICVVAVGSAVALATAAAPVAAAGHVRAADPLPSVPGVPVLARTWIGGPVGNPDAVLTVHGVRRVEGGTVLYYSMGVPEAAQVTKNVYFISYGGGFYNTLSPGSRREPADV